MIKKLFKIIGDKIISLIKVITGYRLFDAMESSKNYRKLVKILSSIGVTVFIGSTVYLLYKQSKDGFDVSSFGSNFADLLTIVLLYLTWVGALWVARETFDQKKIANKQIVESRKLFEYEVGPYLRLQFMNNPSKDGSNVIKIKNHGRGSAVDVEFETINISSGGPMNPIKIMTRPIMTPEGTSFVKADELAKENNTDNMQDNINHMRTWLASCIETDVLEIKCKYKDTAGNKYKAIFKGDKTYFDGFRIVEQRKVS